MSKVAIQGAATGTGVFTLASPATNTNRTLTPPDEAGTVLTRAAGSPDNSVVVDASGNVGIFTSSPDVALDVVGEAIIGNGTYGVKLSYSVGDTAGIIDTGNSANKLSFRIGNSEKDRIDSDGLKFNGDTAAANALDDYEEGTWTPSVGGTATYGAQRNGWYVKIGSLVTVAVDVTISSIGTGSTQLISGLPFNANAGGVTNGGGSVSYWANLSTAVYSIVTQLSGTAMSFVTTTGAQTTVNNVPAVLTSGTRIIATMSYQTTQ